MKGDHGEMSAAADLLTDAIAADSYDVALDLLNMYPDLVLENNHEIGLQNLTTKPNAFRSGSSLGFWQRIIYEWIPVNREKALQPQILRVPSQGINNHNLTKGCYGSNVSLWSMLQYLVPQIRQLHDAKVKHVQVEELVKQMCSIVINKANNDLIAWNALGKAVIDATRNGIYELVEQCLHQYPELIWYGEAHEGDSFLLVAIRERQEKVVNLIYQMSKHKIFVYQAMHGGDNALHMVAKLAPPHRLNTVTGAVLQMQRELQWFKEVENLVHPSHKEDLNIENNTPRKVFTVEHKELLKEAERWMKHTSSLAMVVSALILTLTIAAMLQVPGGINDEGKPLFIDDPVFIFFTIADAVAFFFSLTSVVIFLSIISSGFAEKDFLYALPKRLTLGLISSLISLAAIMVAFSAATMVTFAARLPQMQFVILLACVPMAFFAFLHQYPLLMVMELVCSTYAKGIFYKQNHALLH